MDLFADYISTYRKYTSVNTISIIKLNEIMYIQYLKTINVFRVSGTTVIKVEINVLFKVWIYYTAQVGLNCV